MRPITAAPRRGLLAVSPSPAMPSATAAPDPSAAGDVARTITSVATSTADYLDEHSQTHQALTTIAKQQAPASLPGGPPKAPIAGSPGAVSPTQPAVASPVAQATAALPGAAIASLR